MFSEKHEKINLIKSKKAGGPKGPLISTTLFKFPSKKFDVRVGKVLSVSKNTVGINLIRTQYCPPGDKDFELH